MENTGSKQAKGENRAMPLSRRRSPLSLHHPSPPWRRWCSRPPQPRLCPLTPSPLGGCPPEGQHVGLPRLHGRGCEYVCRASSLADPRETAAFAEDRRTSPVATSWPLASRSPTHQRPRHRAAVGAVLGLASGVAPGTLLPGGSSDEDEHGGSSSR
uniref:Uncharacterized protein n=1 Tax=Triticum urartu TaxID=4572 RepID=A0A8R7TU08_TRIUA